MATDSSESVYGLGITPGMGYITGPEGQRAEEEALRTDRSAARRVVVSVVGRERQGKTSLRRLLAGEPFNENEPSTVGIERELVDTQALDPSSRHGDWRSVELETANMAEYREVLGARIHNRLEKRRHQIPLLRRALNAFLTMTKIGIISTFSLAFFFQASSLAASWSPETRFPVMGATCLLMFSLCGATFGRRDGFGIAVGITQLLVLTEALIRWNLVYSLEDLTARYGSLVVFVAGMVACGLMEAVVATCLGLSLGLGLNCAVCLSAPGHADYFERGHPLVQGEVWVLVVSSLAGIGVGHFRLARTVLPLVAVALPAFLPQRLAFVGMCGATIGLVHAAFLVVGRKLFLALNPVIKALTQSQLGRHMVRHVMGLVPGFIVYGLFGWRLVTCPSPAVVAHVLSAVGLLAINEVTGLSLQIVPCLAVKFTSPVSSLSVSASSPSSASPSPRTADASSASRALSSQSLPPQDPCSKSPPTHAHSSLSPPPHARSSPSRVRSSKSPPPDKLGWRPRSDSLTAAQPTTVLSGSVLGPPRLVIRDFAGHPLYYSAHHVYLAAHCVYVLVFSLVEARRDWPAVRGTLIDWLQSIYLHAGFPDARVLLVGTHRDHPLVRGSSHPPEASSYPPPSSSQHSQAFSHHALAPAHLPQAPDHFPLSRRRCSQQEGSEGVPGARGVADNEKGRDFVKMMGRKLKDELPDHFHRLLVWTDENSPLFPVENSLRDPNDSDHRYLRQQLVKVASEVSSAQFPVRFFYFFVVLDELRTEGTVLADTENLQARCALNQCATKDRADFEAMLGLFVQLGEVLYFPNDNLLQSVVVVSPHAVLRLLAHLVNVPPMARRERRFLDHWEYLATAGICSRALFDHVLRLHAVGLRSRIDTVLYLLQTLNLICSLQARLGPQPVVFCGSFTRRGGRGTGLRYRGHSGRDDGDGDSDGDRGEGRRGSGFGGGGGGGGGDDGSDDNNDKVDDEDGGEVSDEDNTHYAPFSEDDKGRQLFLVPAALPFDLAQPHCTWTTVASDWQLLVDGLPVLPHAAFLRLVALCAAQDLCLHVDTLGRPLIYASQSTASFTLARGRCYKLEWIAAQQVSHVYHGRLLKLVVAGQGQGHRQGQGQGLGLVSGESGFGNSDARTPGTASVENGGEDYLSGNVTHRQVVEFVWKSLAQIIRRDFPRCHVRLGVACPCSAPHQVPREEADFHFLVLCDTRDGKTSQHIPDFQEFWCRGRHVVYSNGQVCEAEPRSAPGPSGEVLLCQPLGSIPHSLQAEICDHLDPPHAMGNDWRALAGKLGLTVRQVELLKCRAPTTPSSVLLQDWACRNPDATLRDLRLVMISMQRHDVVLTIDSFQW